MPTGLEQPPPDQANEQNPVQQARQADIQPHVAIEDMAEFVGYDPLQLIP